MRQAFAHVATLAMDDDADVNALGAAVTAALCGHWAHEPPCPLAPHYSHADRLNGGDVQLRILFTTEPETEGIVRARIESALTTGVHCGPDGSTTRWQLRGSSSSPLKEDERAHAERLARS